MCELATQDPDVSALMSQERYQEAVKDFEGVEATNDAEPANWMDRLEINSQTGLPKATIDNVWIILENDPLLKGKFALNQFAGRGEVLDALPWNASTKRRLWDDNDNNGLYWYMEKVHHITGNGKIDGALSLHTTQHAFNEVQDYLQSLKWDGVPRLDTLFIDYLGAEDSPYTRAVTRKAFTAAVTRAMVPGSKYDNMLILAGPQGIGKSTLLDKMSRGWFNDSIRTFEGKEASELLQGVWLVEIGELDAFRKTDVACIKQFLSLRSDRFRAAYGEQNAIDGAWMKQLENASARVHISRLEALKLQLQQQAEVLYSNQLDYVDAAARKMYEGSYYHTAFELQKGLGVGWTMQAINEETITNVLSRPWTTDNQTFRDRCWTNKQSLVNSVNTQLTQMVIRGEAPDRAISAISKQFDVSRAKAGRLVMTESAYFSSAGQKDCYKALDVERYKIVASFDKDTCSLCADMDGKVFKMSEYQVGLTAPPFHPWCRCCTCPYFEDMDGMGERYARDAVTGERFKVPGNMTYDQWKAQQDALHGQGTVDKMRKISYNETTDRAQFEKYRERLGADAPRYFKDFQALKYDHAAEYKDLAGLYSYKGRVPEASKADYKAYKAVKATGVIGTVRVPPETIDADILTFNDAHAARHGCTLDDAKGYVRAAKCTVRRKRWDGVSINCYSLDGAAYIDADTMKVKTAFSEKDFDPTTKAIAEVFR